MRIAIDSFRGEVPRLTPRALPANAAQLAINAKLVSGDLEAWRQFVSTKVLTASANVKTIAQINGQWMSWTEVVDVARGIIAGDTSFRTYLTGPAVYTKPRWTNFTLATTGAEPYPVATRPIGVPGPTMAPTVVVDVTASEDSNITLTNPGAESGSTTGWTIDAGSLVVLSNGDIAGLNAQAGTKFFGSGNVATTEAHQDHTLTPGTVIAGQGLKLAWHQATGANGSTATMSIEFYNNVSSLISTFGLPELAPGTSNTWLRREFTALVPTNAVTARLVQNYTRVGATMDAYIDSITLNSVDYSNYFDGSTLAGWDVSPAAGTPGSSNTWRLVEIDAANGWAAPSILLRGDQMVPWMHRDFSTDQSPAVVLKFDFSFASVNTLNGVMVNLFANLAGNGTALMFTPNGVQSVTCSSWDDYGAGVESFSWPMAYDTQYTAELRAEKSGTGEAIVTINVTATATGTSVMTNQKVKIAVNGPRVGFKGFTGSLDSTGRIDNIYITVAAPKPLESVDSTATSYVYRFVNDVGEASAPSDASQTVVRPDGGAVIVTTPTTNPPAGADAEHNITLKQIYRSVSGLSGDFFVFVAEIPLAQADYTDAFDDADIINNEPLDSEDWDPPPTDMEGIIALPNGIMAGFRKNQLCLSVSGHPHAWRTQDRLTVDTDIVAIANIDNTIVIGTKSFAYTATGTSNDTSYTLSAPGAKQACVSKRSMRFLDGVGVVFASPDGWMACAGSAGVLTNITEGVFKKTQWEALDPSSIIAEVYDGILFWFSTGQTPDSGYALDVRSTGFGLISLSFHANALYADPLTDKLYMVLDVMNEPVEATLPVASTAPSLGSSPFKTIYQFDAHATNLLRFQYRGKLHLTPYPAQMPFGQVRASEFSNLVARIYRDSTLIKTKLVSNGREFQVPALKASDTYELEFVGTSTVRTGQLAEDVMELA